jgi:hypothetical protein
MTQDISSNEVAHVLELSVIEVRELGNDTVDDLVAGHALDNDLREGTELHDAAAESGYTDAAAHTLVDRYRKFVEQRNLRDQIALF